VSIEFTEIASQALALPAPERVLLAQQIWQSLGESSECLAEIEISILAEARRRDQELESGQLAERTHDEVMKAARSAIQ
jgi:putative addiction module component (TIGR02574 family)